MLAKIKLNRIETLISQALIYLGISHEEFKINVNEEENYRKLKNVKMMKSSDELNKEEGKKIKTTQL